MIVLLALAEGSIQLVPDGSIFLHIALILIMVGVLNRTLFRPINAVMEERERKGSGTLAESFQLQGEVQTNLGRYESAIRSAKAERYRLAELQRTEALEERQRSLDASRAEITSLIEAEKGSIRESANKVRDELAAESEKMAAQIQEQILKPISGRKTREL